MGDKKAMSFRFNDEVYDMIDELVDYFAGTTPFGPPSKTAVVELAIREMHEAYISNHDKVLMKLAKAEGIPVDEKIKDEEFNDWDEDWQLPEQQNVKENKSNG